MDPILAIQLVLNGLSFGALLFLVASGFTLIFGLMRISNLAHGGFYIVGAYVAVVVVSFTSNFWLGVLAGAIAAGVVGLVTERGLLRRVRNQEMPEVLVTVGVLFVIGDLLLAIFGGDPKTVNTASGAPSGALVIGSFAYPQYRLFIIVVTVVIGVVLFVIQRYSRIGAIVRAGVDNREMAAAHGDQHRPGLHRSVHVRCVAGRDLRGDRIRSAQPEPGVRNRDPALCDGRRDRRWFGQH